MRSLNKKAQSHIEMILSFILFTGFVIFILIVLNPFSKTSIKISKINDIEKAVMNQIAPELPEIDVIVGEKPNDCFKLESFVQDFGDNYLDVRNPPNEKRYEVYFGDMLQKQWDTNKPQCWNTGSDDYYNDAKFSAPSKEKIVVYNLLENLKNNYNNNYQNLKTNLKISRDFYFRVINEDGTEKIAPKHIKIPTGVNVESRYIPIRVLKDKTNTGIISGEIKEWVLILKVW